MNYSLEAVGLVHSPFREKFAIPRQPRLVAAESHIELLPPFDREEALTGLEGFSHLWVIFVFHECLGQGWKPTVRPPRLGGNRRLGVFATRSTFRPNPIGMSAVELVGYGREEGKLIIRIRGADLLDGTPVLDIKPYVPYADSIPDTRAGFASEPPAPVFRVNFSHEAQQALDAVRQQYPDFEDLITQVLRFDARPAYRGGTEDRIYGVRLYEFDVKWRVEGETEVMVVAVEPAS